MKFNNILKIAVIILLLLGLALISPDPRILTKDTAIQPTYIKVADFLDGRLGFETSIKESLWVALYSFLIGTFIWIYYHLILLLKLIVLKDWGKVRYKEEEGKEKNSRLLSLSKYRIINLLFGRIYKVLAFAIFTAAIYNIPIINRLIYLYTLEFLKMKLLVDAIIMAILIITLPRIIDSFLLEKRKNETEKRIMKKEKIKAMTANSNE